MKKAIALLLSLFVLTSCSSAAPSSGSEPQSSSSTPQSVSEPVSETSSIVNEVASTKETIQFHDVSFDIDSEFPDETVTDSLFSIVWEDKGALLTVELIASGMIENYEATPEQIELTETQLIPLAHESVIEGFLPAEVNTINVEIDGTTALRSNFIGNIEGSQAVILLVTLANNNSLYHMMYVDFGVSEDFSRGNIDKINSVVDSVKWVESSISGNELATETETPTMGESNALSKAHDYLDYTAFSYTGLIGQLEYEGFSIAEATYAVDNCGADWNEQAAIKAQEYLDYSSFSRQGLIDQLLYEGFTPEQAEYGVSAVGY